MLSNNELENQVIISMIEYPNNIDEFIAKVPLNCFSKNATSALNIINELNSRQALTKNNFINSLNATQAQSDYFINLLATLPYNNYLALASDFIQSFRLEKQRENAMKLLEASDNKTLLDLSSLEANITSNEYKNLEQWQSFYENKPLSPKFKSNIAFLDSVFDGGFEVAQLVLISGDPEAGKTTLGLQILENISQYSKVGFFSFEFTIEQYIRAKQNDNRKKLFENMIIINDGYELYQIAQNIKNLYKQGVRVFLIDSQMRITSPNGRNMEEEESLKFSLLAKLCHSMDILIFLIVQTSKSDRDNPMGSKKGGHEASIIIRIEHDKPQNESLREFSEDSRMIILKKNKQTGKHYKERVHYDCKNRIFKPMQAQKDIKETFSMEQIEQLITMPQF